MRKSIRLLAGWLLAILLTTSASAQVSTIKGKINAADGSKENLAAVSVIVKGSTSGTYTDKNGEFSLTGNFKYPLTLVITGVGYETKEVNVDAATQSLAIDLKSSAVLGQEIVISATRVATRILESPVSIERVNAAGIQNAPASSYYDIVTKG
jgi:hypothetical protein